MSYTITKISSGTYNFTASYTINEEHNGIEISFSEKPGDIIRDQLKEYGYRWHKAKKVWYAPRTEKREDLAIRLTTRDERRRKEAQDAREAAQNKLEQVQEAAEQVAFVIPSASFVDGGGLYDGWKGGRNAEWHTDKELKALLLSDFKRAGISASIRFERAGYLTAFLCTIKITADEIKPYDEWEKSFTVPSSGWITYYDEDGKHHDIFADRYWSMTADERETLLPIIKRGQYQIRVNNLTNNSISHCRECDVLTEKGNKIHSTVCAIVDSYNRDCSNGMVDYFDRDIYDSYTFKIA